MSYNQPATSVSSGARTMSIIGIVLGVIAVFILPIVVGTVGAILGFVANSKGDKPLGMYVGIGCIVATVVGTLLQRRGDRLGGAILVLAVVFVSYYSGGYVAGRMARFDGIRQGLAVFGWAVVAAVVVAVLGAVAGAKYDVLDELNSFPRIPGDLSDLSLAAVVVLLGVVVAALVGSALGGLAGMHFHRRVDRAGLAR